MAIARHRQNGHVGLVSSSISFICIAIYFCLSVLYFRPFGVCVKIMCLVHRSWEWGVLNSLPALRDLHLIC
jgi:hypothetical protein